MSEDRTEDIVSPRGNYNTGAIPYEVRTETLSDILFAGTAEEHQRTRENLEELMRAVMERRSNLREEQDDDSDG